MNKKKNNKTKKALVVGSVALDLIFRIKGTIRDQINQKDGVLVAQNFMFSAKNKERFFGGTGGNIAYGLGLLGEKPILVSVAGQDFPNDFGKHLENYGVDSRVHIEKNGWTATFYGISDQNNEQIGIWQPNAYEKKESISILEKIPAKELQDVAVAIFSAGTAKSIYKHMKEVRNALGKKMTAIFDPGQILSFSYDKNSLARSLRLANIFIVNEVELSQAEKILGVPRHSLFNSGIQTIIETKGKNGSVIYQKTGQTNIPAKKSKKVIDPTGAGDAFRAGLIHGLLSDMSLEKCCEIGSMMGARCVEQKGGQTYRLIQESGIRNENAF